MKSFEHNGKRVDFHAVTGEVTGLHKRSDIDINVRGGDGFIHNGTGHIKPINVEAKAVVKLEFFLKPHSGNEVPVMLSDMDIPLKDGLNVTMISGHVGDVDIWTRLVNHNAARFWKLGHTLDQVFKWDLVRKPWISMLIGIVLWIVVAYLLNGTVGFLAAVAYWVYEGMKVKAAVQSLESFMDGLGREMLMHGAAVT